MGEERRAREEWWRKSAGELKGGRPLITDLTLPVTAPPQGIGKQQIQDQDQNPVAGREMCVCLDVCVLETMPKSDEIPMILSFF